MSEDIVKVEIAGVQHFFTKAEADALTPTVLEDIGSVDARRGQWLAEQEARCAAMVDAGNAAANEPGCPIVGRVFCGQCQKPTALGEFRRTSQGIVYEGVRRLPDVPKMSRSERKAYKASGWKEPVDALLGRFTALIDRPDTHTLETWPIIAECRVHGVQTLTNDDLEVVRANRKASPAKIIIHRVSIRCAQYNRSYLKRLAGESGLSRTAGRTLGT